MFKVYGIHHTQLDSLSVAPYNVRTLFGIDDGPLEMASDFFPHRKSFYFIEIPIYMKSNAYSVLNLLQIHILGN